MILVWLFLAIIFFFLTIFLHFHHMKNFWKNRGIPSLPPQPIVGNALTWLQGKVTLHLWMQQIYKSINDYDYAGIHIFTSPRLVVKSPKLIQRILVKDFQYFQSRCFADCTHDIVTKNWMFFQQDNVIWKASRSKFTPLFSSLKIKTTFPIFNTVGKEMVEYIRKSSGILEAKNLAGRYTSEVTYLGFFGVKAYSFEENSYLHNSIKEMNIADGNTIFRQACYQFFHYLVNPLRLTFLSQTVMNNLTETSMAMLQKRSYDRNCKTILLDILNGLLRDEDFVKNNKFYGKAVAGPMIQFLFGGYETGAATIAFSCYEFAINPEIQEKARENVINSFEKFGDITYDAIQDMKYLKLCIQEVLRKYPTLAIIDRKCCQDYKIPGTNKIIKKGEGVVIPLMGLHYDENYFPEPEKFIPERFEDKINVDGLYYLPFGDGPRYCIGERFALINVQACLAYILKNFKIETTDETLIPLKLDPRSVNMIPKGGIILKFTELNK